MTKPRIRMATSSICSDMSIHNFGTGRLCIVQESEALSTALARDASVDERASDSARVHVQKLSSGS